MFKRHILPHIFTANTLNTNTKCSAHISMVCCSYYFFFLLFSSASWRLTKFTLLNRSIGKSICRFISGTALVLMSLQNNQPMKVIPMLNHLISFPLIFHGKIIAHSIWLYLGCFPPLRYILYVYRIDKSELKQQIHSFHLILALCYIGSVFKQLLWTAFTHVHDPNLWWAMSSQHR